MTRPNVVFVLLDDVGFGASEVCGGPISTPTFARLAERGLLYNRFHTTAICSPTRASLLTGRSPHAAGVGTVMNSAVTDLPGYNGELSDETATIAEILSGEGYATACVGKWHLAPALETSPAGPFQRWPTGKGFDHFYGFLGGETDQFEPSLYQGTSPIARPPGDDYHLTTDLVDHSIAWIRTQRTMGPDRPFFCYLAPGATHAPLQVPEGWADRYRGRFDDGWDAHREATLARAIELGVVPAGTDLTERPGELPAWTDLAEDQRRVAAALMEVYAGFLEHTDAELGRLVAALEADGLFDNTIFVYIMGDNGPSAEAGIPGSINYFGALQGLQEPVPTQLRELPGLGSADSYPQYPAAWAWAMSSPFQWVKQVASHFGGTRNPTVLSWPDGIDRPGLRSQFGHVNDLVPTVLEAAGIDAPDTVAGVPQKPMDGVSLSYTFEDPAAPERHTTQYFEVFGHRSVYHDGWIASAFHRAGMPWTVARAPQDVPLDEDVWQLYDTTTDFSQAHDLADRYPEKLAELQELFAAEITRAGVVEPVDVRVLGGGRRHQPIEDVSFRAPLLGIPELMAPRLPGRSWSFRVDAEFGDADRGVFFTMGGRTGGLALWLDPQGLVRARYRVFEFGNVDLSAPGVTGRHHVELRFTADKPGQRATSGTLDLLVDGDVVDSGTLRVTQPAMFSVDEPVSVGGTTGSPVGDYPGDYPFTGQWHGARLLVEPVR